MVDGVTRHAWFAEVAEAARRTDARAFFVPPRIVRRVIKQDRDLPGLGFRVPHRKSYVVSGRRIGKFVEKDELELAVTDDYPEFVFLLAEPKESELAGMTRDDVARWASRLLFHARTHFELERQIEAGEITPANVRAAVDGIGQVEFDEVQAVLLREHFLEGHPDRTDVLVEFAAVYWEYRYFSPDRLPWYFPSLSDYDRLDEILSAHCDVARLYDESQIRYESGGRDDVAPHHADGNGRPVDGEPHAGTKNKKTKERQPNPRRYLRRMLAAERAIGRGNAARGAIQYVRAAEFGTDDERAECDRLINGQIGDFVNRLQRAVHFEDGLREEWRTALRELLTSSRAGFWNTDRRLLSDLQKVCLDHEQAVYRIDLIEWVRTRGKRPIKRKLPFQREVLIVKHLRSAASRMKSTQLSEESRTRLSHLLRAAVKSAEDHLRNVLRPVARDVLAEVGFSPSNPPEDVAFKKLVEEVLDGVVKKGYVNMGSLRDAISRNQVKLADLSGPAEFLKGDYLLQADRRMGVELDGVYRRGEFYLRWLQRLSSVAFGTKIGRWITLFLLIPFGGAYTALSFIIHLMEKVLPEDVTPHWTLTEWVQWTAGVGVFLLALVHSAEFREGVSKLMLWLVRILGSILIDMPKWAIRNPAIRQFLRSPPVVFLRRFVLVPGLLTAGFYFALPFVGLYATPSIPATVGIFFLLAAALNSRIGRDFEELTTDWVEHTWYQLRTRVFIAFFESIMAFFKAVLEFIERFLYAVDEWLRFRSGESQITLGVKAIFGLLWAVVSLVTTFCITLLIEPQINPIKHFPVVTVSHKILLPMEYNISRLFEGALDEAAAHAIAFLIVTTLPGVFGFLVWELRSNWRLYTATRPTTLRPAVVGDHGETVGRLLKPGFHSGTLPKLFHKIRRAVRKRELRTGLEFVDADAPPMPQLTPLPAKYSESMHHLEEAVRHFLERDLIALLERTNVVPEFRLTVGEIRTASNNFCLDVECNGGEHRPLVLVFQEQSARLVTGILQEGWLASLDDDRRQTVGVALAGLYHLSGSQLVREQILSCFGRRNLRYDITERRLVVWPQDAYEVEVCYEFDERPTILPIPPMSAEKYGLPAIPVDALVFAERRILWDDWVAYWTDVADGKFGAPPRHSSLPTLLDGSNRPLLAPVVNPPVATRPL